MRAFISIVCLLAFAAAAPQEFFEDSTVEGSGDPPADIAENLIPEARSSLNFDGEVNSNNDVQILRANFDTAEDGAFQYGFASSDGTEVDTAGEIKQFGEDKSAVVMRGSYSYVDPEGNTITTNWVADELGFRATGAHIPAVPEYVAQLLRNLPTGSSSSVEEPSTRLVVDAAPEVAVEPAAAVEASADVASEEQSLQFAEVAVAAVEDTDDADAFIEVQADAVVIQAPLQAEEAVVAVSPAVAAEVEVPVLLL